MNQIFTRFHTKKSEIVRERHKSICDLLRSNTIHILPRTEYSDYFSLIQPDSDTLKGLLENLKTTTRTMPARDDASAITDEESSYGPVPPPPSGPPPREASFPAYADEEDVIENMPAKSDPPPEYPDGTAIDEEDLEDVSVEIPPTQVVQRMIKEEQSRQEKGNSKLGYVAGISACCLVVLAVVLGAGFGSGAFKKSSGGDRGGIPPLDPPAPTEPNEPQEPAPAPTPSISAIQALISSNSHNSEALGSPESPEARAVLWVAADESLILDADDSTHQFRILQRYALASLFFASSGWENDAGWLENADECTWYGITCEQQDLGGEIGVQNVVVRVEMENNGVQAITPDLALLVRTAVLNFSDNPLEGNIPSSISKLTELREMFFDDCRMSGDLSAMDWSGLTNLEVFSIPGNSFTGALNESFFSMTNLQEIFIGDGNRLSGEISSSIGNLVELRILDASGHTFTGTLPPTLGELTALEILDLGSIPSVPSLSGPIPDEISGLVALRELNLEHNRITGVINPALGDLQLTSLRLGNNPFTQAPIPSFVYDMFTLEEITMDNCRLTGAIDAQIGDLVNLRMLVLDANFLQGPIPEEIGNLVNLQELSLSLNIFDSPLPASIVNLSEIRIIDFTRSRITGPIPATIGAMQNLEILKLGTNSLTGEIPVGETGITRLINLQELELHENALSSRLPFAMGGLFNLRVFRVNANVRTDVENSGIIGMLPPSLGGLRNLEEFVVSNNLMTGALPTDLGRMPAIRVFDIEGNGFSGEVPEEIVNWSNIEEIYIARNNFTAGVLPEGLCAIESLTSLVADCEVQNSCSTCPPPTAE